VLLPDAAPDDRIYLTSAQAGEVAGVSAAAVRRWEQLGYLASITEPPERKLYEYDAVKKAEKMARDAAIRTSGTDTRARRRAA
jgi:predicted site-specific integrase-resolvase